MNNNITPMLQCIDVTKKIKDFSLSEINFELEPGYVLGIIGRNGTGKSTMLKTILGSEELSSGDILINGISIKKDVVKYKEQTAYVFNETVFPMWMTSLECGNVYGKYYKSFDKEKYKKLLRDFSVPEKVKIKKISTGEQIKQQLAFALSYDAKLYVLDEPTGNLDVEFREYFYKIVRELMEGENRSIIYVSHLVDELEKLADYILWINKDNAQRYYGTLDDLKNQYQLIEAGKDAVLEIKEDDVIGRREKENHQEMLVKISRNCLSEKTKQISRYATLKEIIYYTEKKENLNETGIISYLS